MNIYEKKSQWKLWLAFFAMVIIIASLWYTSIISQRIASDEKKQVKIWAEAIQERASLVESARVMFEKLASEERDKAILWTSAINRTVNIKGTDLDPLVLEVIETTDNIPALVIDNNQVIQFSANLIDFEFAVGDTILRAELDSFTFYDPLIMPMSGSPDWHIYYRDSKLFRDIKLEIRKIITSFIQSVVINSASVPVIYADSLDNMIYYGNLDSSKVLDPQYIQKTIAKMKSENDPIDISIGAGGNFRIYYQDSYLLKQIELYPFIQLAIIGLFLLISYYAFSTTRKAEQNQVWVGMSKETAHQLGTPISSLVGWVELLRAEGVDERILNELAKDVDRLELITERFSKIGSTPDLHAVDLKSHLEEVINYLKIRASKQVVFSIVELNIGTQANINPPLFDWVIENLIKNALDAMEGKGQISLELNVVDKQVQIDIIDTGKGIPKSRFKQVFNPGFSTKKRGWGLGLSLSKRIIENYHKGKIYVKKSSPDHGSTFRITVPVAGS